VLIGSVLVITTVDGELLLITVVLVLTTVRGVDGGFVLVTSIETLVGLMLLVHEDGYEIVDLGVNLTEDKLGLEDFAGVGLEGFAGVGLEGFAGVGLEGFASVGLVGFDVGGLVGFDVGGLVDFDGGGLVGFDGVALVGFDGVGLEGFDGVFVHAGNDGVVGFGGNFHQCGTLAPVTSCPGHALNNWILASLPRA